MVDPGGAALGAVFGELLAAVRQGIVKACKFKTILEQIESSIKDVDPVLEKMQKRNEGVDRPNLGTEDFIKKFEEGKQLVLKCQKVKWDPSKRIYYSGRLQTLNGLLKNFIQVNMQLQQTSDTMDILETVTDNKEMLRKLANKESSGSPGGKKLGRPCSVSDPPECTFGLDVPLKELKDLLKEGEQLIVVTAPPGSGKTTLVQKLCKDDQVKGKFKGNIFYVIVSENPDVKVIVQEIFQHKGYEVPKFQTDEKAFNGLENLFKEIGTEPILLVLDDVWPSSKSMLERFNFKLPDYKILVTSRSKFKQLGSEYDLKPLNDNDARDLFNHSANLTNGGSYNPNPNLVDKVIKACKGSPLSLTVVGGSLNGQSAAVWKKSEKEWIQDGNIFDSNDDLRIPLQKSLDILDNQYKESYMDLGSFREDQRIPATVLIDMWRELHGLPEDFYAITNLEYLFNRNLVNLVITRKKASDDGCYNDHFVIQHDLLRELIIHLSKVKPIEERKRLFLDISGDNFPEWLLEQKQQPVKARLISISTDQTFSSHWHDMEAPNVEVVVLNIQSEKYILPNFLKGMNKLKVLIVTNYGFFPSELSNFEVLSSLPNLKRIRLEHVIIPPFEMTIIQMKKLHKISFVMCNVGQVFRNSTFQISLAFPNLEEMNIDYCNDLEELPEDLCELVSLKIISITNCHNLSGLPVGIGKLENLQRLILASCSTRLVELPDTIGNLSNLNFLDISECLSIKELPIQIGKLSSLETLCMRGCSGCELPTSIRNLANLAVVKCDRETALKWKQHNLAKLRVEVVEEDINLHWLHGR